MILGVISDGTETGTFVFEESAVQNDRGQLWEKGATNSQGFFTLKNPGSGKFLTATSFSDRLAVQGTVPFNSL